MPTASCCRWRPAPPTSTPSFHKPTWTLALDHDLWDGTLVYATMRSGYRSGAINSAAVQPAALIVAQPENVTDYEVGVKSDWTMLGHAGAHQPGGYFSDYHDIQVLVVAAQCHRWPRTVSGGACTQAQFNAGNCLAPSPTTMSR